MKIEMTYHASVERTDRFVAILTTIGIGEVVKHYYQPENDCELCLTDTGCILVRSGNVNGRLVTGFCASLAQAKKFYDDRLPSWLYAKVEKNYKKYRYLMEI